MANGGGIPGLNGASPLSRNGRPRYKSSMRATMPLKDVDEFFAKVVASQKAWAERHGAYALQNSPNYRGAYEHYFGKL